MKNPNRVRFSPALHMLLLVIYDRFLVVGRIGDEEAKGEGKLRTRLDITTKHAVVYGIPSVQN
jgi:hypothetical protein